MSYFSKATQDISEEIISGILEKSRDLNKALVVNGCLVFRKLFFVRIIQCDMGHMQSFYEEIWQDNRYHQVTLLGEGKNIGRNLGKCIWLTLQNPRIDPRVGR